MVSLVFTIARIEDGKAVPLGTCFGVGENLFATCFHVVGISDEGLVLPILRGNYDEYQTVYPASIDASSKLEIVAADPIADLMLLRATGVEMGGFWDIDGADSVKQGDHVAVLGYPHCVEARFVMTRQDVQVGAKIYLRAEEPRVKGLVLNTLSRPGQSGSPVLDARSRIVGVVLGAHVRSPRPVMMIGGVNPETIHQTTHAVSAEYLKEMLCSL